MATDHSLTIGNSGLTAESPYYFNGVGTGSAAQVDRARSGSQINLATKQAPGALITTKPGQWTASAQATAGTPSASKAAGGAGVSHVCTGIVASVAAAATAQTPVIVNLRDGATGAGTILATFALSAPANGTGIVSIAGLNIIGTANTAMTLEFAGATAAAVVGSVNLVGYDAV